MIQPLRKVFPLILFSLILATACNPVEEITDTYASVVDSVLPDDDNDEDAVGELIVTSGTATVTNAANSDIIVLNKKGSRMTRTVKVTCTYTNTLTGERVAVVDGFTTSGLANCEVLNTTGADIGVFLVVRSEGVTSEVLTFAVEGDTA